METAAGPEDELRVLAALDAMGADAEEPIEVKLDSARHEIVVTGVGLTLDRQKQVETALSRHCPTRWSTSAQKRP